MLAIVSSNTISKSRPVCREIAETFRQSNIEEQIMENWKVGPIQDDDHGVGFNVLDHNNRRIVSVSFDNRQAAEVMAAGCAGDLS